MRRAGDSDRLPTAPFGLIDELACYYDTRADPNNVHLEVLVPGHLDYHALRQATADALAATERARARMAPGSVLRSGYVWEFPRDLDVDPVSRTTWADERELAAIRASFLGMVVPLRRSPPLRLLLASGPGTDLVLLNGHHAALDGRSCLELLRDIAARYRTLTQPPVTARPSAAAGSFAQSPPIAGAENFPRPGAEVGAGSEGTGEAGRAGGGAASRGPSPLARARAVAGLARRRAARIAGEPAPRGQRGQHEGVGVRLLVVSSVPKPPGASVNDVLLAALIATVGRWNDAHGKRRRPVRITVPVDVRVPGAQGEAGNFTTIVSVTAQPPGAGEDLVPLLAEVTSQTRALRDARPQQPSAGVLGVAPPWLPVPLKRLAVQLALRTVGGLVCDTCMLTNLGNIADPPWSEIGGSEIREPVRIAVTGPPRMPRGLAAGAASVDGQLQFVIRYRHSLLGDAAAARFLQELGHVMDEMGKLDDLGNDAVGDGGSTRGVAGGPAQDSRVPGR